MNKILILISTVFLFVSCSSSTKPLVESPQTSVNKNYPEWYGAYRFSSDSTHFNASATAVSADRNEAQIRAEKEARANLESYIAKELEDIRRDIEVDGSKVMTNPSFILKLRNAHYKIESQATVLKSEVRSVEGVYRAFASVQISKQEVMKLLDQGLNSNPRYVSEFLKSVQLTAFLGS